MEPRDGPAEALTGAATTRLRMVGYCLVLTATAFVQQPGRLVGDTKFDLVVDPMSFLARAWRLWDPTAAFGQVQNQAYGYFWPMGPFFSLLHAAALPGWVVQRLWWSVLLCVAFVGVVRVAQAMRLGTPGTQVLAGFAFALSPHVLTLLGPTSVEAWPTAWAPWVLLPLVLGSERGSPRRAAALSALAVAMCGGVNGAAVLAVLPVGAIWLLTRSPGARRHALLLWWPPLVLAATLWWSVPLLLLGRYSPPFLAYIENAPITTSTTSLPDVLSGTSDWVAYASPADWVAGHLLGTTPLLLVDAAAVAGLGLAGICRRDNPHSRFLFLSVVAGLTIVTFGYTGPVHGWLADLRQAQLDGPLAALRNTHKFDVVLRLPLVLGLAHLVASVQALPRDLGARALRTGVLMAAVAAVAGVAIPAYSGDLAPGAPVQAVPDYWFATARYLAAHPGGGTALELPAAPFGDYLWGSPHDDILQAVARSPWAVRNIVPLAQPGNVLMLDAITAATEIGRPDPRLAGFLASNGVGYLVVRNDLQPFRSGAPDAVVLHQSLDRSPGLHRVASFGPQVGSGAEVTTAAGRRLLTSRGRSARYPAVEIYRVDPVSSQDTPQVTALVASTVPVVSGDPGSRLATAASDTAAVLAGDTRGRRFGPTYLTDGLTRRETAFTTVRRNQSAAMTPQAPWRLRSVQHSHRLYPAQPRWETTLGWTGITGVSASSSMGFADAVPPIDTAESPAAAVDGRRWTEFVSSSRTGAAGQWWRLRLSAPASPPVVSITMGAAQGGEVTALRLVTDAGAETVEAPAPGATGTYPLPPGSTRSLEIQAARVKDDHPGTQLALAEVSVPGLVAGRELTLPDAFTVAPDEIVLGREPQRSACSTVNGTTVCDDFQGTVSEDANVLRRRVILGQRAGYTAVLRARLRSTRGAARAVAGRLPVRVTGSSRLSVNPAAGPLATVDGNPGSTWVASTLGSPRLHVAWARPARITRIQLTLGTAAGASAPRQVTIVAGGQRRAVTIDPRGRGSFRALRTARLTIIFGAVR
ncbi:MAG: alpha-(1-_3)-arabinofuranosyltransferase domain-containing protein, partial [Oryzihumus sp.]